MNALLTEARGGSADGRATLMASSGRAAPVHLRVNWLERPEGATICMVGVDLTQVETSGETFEQVQAQRRALAESEERLARSARELAERVQERTAELERADGSLRREIAERVRVEARLRESEKRFRAVFDLSTDGKCLTSLEGQPVKVNAALADLLGRTAEELQQVNLAFITHPDDVPAKPRVHTQPSGDGTRLLPDGAAVSAQGRALPLGRCPHGLVAG